MSESIDRRRRDLLRFTGRAGLATLTAQAVGVNLGLVDVAQAQGARTSPFRFAIISDSHLFSIKDHKFDKSMEDAVAQVNALSPAVDFVAYLGDIAQNGTEDQLAKGRQILGKLKAPLKVIPGEHDWYLDMGAAWRGMFGPDNWSFDHKGVHFIGMNSILVKDFWTAAGLSPRQRMGAMEMLEGEIGGLWGVGDRTLEWLSKDVARLSPATPVVVFTHSPLWDYYPRWNFQTRDAPQIRASLAKFAHVMAFHGHVHQTVFNKIGNLTSAGQLSTSWPWPYPDVKLPYPGSQMNRADPANEQDGMGTAYVDIAAAFKGSRLQHQPFADSLTTWMKDGYAV